MNKLKTQILLGFLAAACARADTLLTITDEAPSGCLQNAFLFPSPITATGTFTLNSVSGTGIIQSGVYASAPTFSYPPEAYFFNYMIDMSKLSSASNHCVKLLIHFGAPQGCGYDEVFGGTASIQSATLAPFGDITFVFAGGCLSPGQPSVGFTMFSEAVPKTNIVTVIDDYVDPASEQTNESRVNVTAVVPDIAPDPPPWIYYHPFTVPYAFFQGSLSLVGTNQLNTNTPGINTGANGSYDFTLQLLNGPSNGLALSQVVTQTVQVVNGLFSLPLPFDPATVGDASSWLSIAVRPTGVAGAPFTPLNSPLPIAPTPQAYYAYSAGVVADLAPGQAVTSLNGLTDAINLQAGTGIILGTNGNTLMLSTQPAAVSDRNLKTGFMAVKPEDILARLAALPIQSWRFTNESAGIRHVGPMAQDFNAAFGVGNDEKLIAFVDGQGVALAAIQGLNQKLNEKEAEIQNLKEDNQALAGRLNELEAAVKALAERNKAP